jgi:hypothetical protein
MYKLNNQEKTSKIYKIRQAKITQASKALIREKRTLANFRLSKCTI